MNFFFSGIDANENQIITSENPEKGNLYLGNIKTAKNENFFKEKKVKFCLSVLQKKLSYFDHMSLKEINQKTISAYDIPSFQIYPFLNEAADFIEKSLNESNVLVHCGSGISRSTTCVIAFFIKYKNMTMEQAWELVKTKRSIVHPNRGFQKQLKLFEDFLKKNKVNDKKEVNDGFNKNQGVCDNKDCDKDLGVELILGDF